MKPIDRQRNPVTARGVLNAFRRAAVVGGKPTKRRRSLGNKGERETQ